jgi:ATP-dependent Lon protease
LKCFNIAPDEKFVQYLQFLERNFDTNRVYDFIHMLLTCVSLPQYINTYKFLVNVDSHALQDVYQEKNLSLMLEKMNGIFTDFVNKIEIWSKLEQQYDFKADQAKTQKKLEEIYESLKKHFSTEKDDKHEQVKQFLEDLKGKQVPEHVMKVINEEIQRFI